MRLHDGNALRLYATKPRFFTVTNGRYEELFRESLAKAMRDCLLSATVPHLYDFQGPHYNDVSVVGPPPLIAVVRRPSRLTPSIISLNGT